MTELFLGEKTFEIEQKINERTRDFDGEGEMIDGANMTLEDLANIFAGGSLFGDSRLIFIKNLSENKTAFDVLPNFLTRNTSDNHVVLVEKKLDKRSKTYKFLAKNTAVFCPQPWRDSDFFLAEQWVLQEAKKQLMKLDPKAAKILVARVGVDQWQLFQSLKKLQPLQTVTADDVEAYIEQSPQQNVFELFTAALSGNTNQVVGLLESLKITQDPYMLQGLLASQAVQLAAVFAADGRDSHEVAKEIGAQPFALKKLTPFATDYHLVKTALAALAQSDSESKTLTADIWLLLERALLEISAAAKQ